jgi:hypothetical protein
MIKLPEKVSENLFFILHRSKYVKIRSLKIFAPRYKRIAAILKQTIRTT